MVMMIRISGHRDGNADDLELDRLVVMKGFRMGRVLRPLGGGRAARRGLRARSSRRLGAPPKNNMVLYSVVGRLMWSLRLDSPRLLLAGDVVPVRGGGARRSGFVRKGGS